MKGASQDREDNSLTGGGEGVYGEKAMGGWGRKGDRRHGVKGKGRWEGRAEEGVGEG